jgi:aromatic-L-amino-acid decarboxylase
LSKDELRRTGHEIIDWVSEYLDGVGKYPVLPPVKPGEIRSRLPDHPPEEGEDIEDIFADFSNIILPGVTHWNHPRFFAYFPANNSAPSILGEILSAALGVNAMLWQTCPAATELEEQMMEWLKQMLGLPTDFSGVIQDTASVATLCALVCARERATDFEANSKGLQSQPDTLRIYTSTEGHSSVIKGARIAGFGEDNVVMVDVDDDFAMNPESLEQAIAGDLQKGHRPCCVVATVGTTSSTAIDPLVPIGEICREHDLWLHVDAALAGSAAILPEKRWILDGIETADSFVFNPHKWLFTNFDCSAYFTRDVQTLTKAMSITPEYLRTDQDRRVTNFRDWGIQLGRRFRALKLWFVIRNYGVEGLREKLREHIALAQELRSWIEEDPMFELLAPVPLNTVCFRFHPRSGEDDSPPEHELDELNKALMSEVNSSGRMFITHTSLAGKYTLRFSIGQTETKREDVLEGWRLISDAEVVRRRPER